jgi:hypothetical protein
MIVLPTVVLPQPDSPTSPTISPPPYGKGYAAPPP